MKKIQFKLCGDLKIKEFCVSLFRGQVFFLLTLFLKTGINMLPSSLTIMIQFFNLKDLAIVEEAFLLLSHVRGRNLKNTEDNRR